MACVFGSNLYSSSWWSRNSKVSFDRCLIDMIHVKCSHCMMSAFTTLIFLNLAKWTVRHRKHLNQAALLIMPFAILRAVPWMQRSMVRYGCFQKWWYPTTMSFPTKNDHFGVFWGYPYFWKHPYGEMMWDDSWIHNEPDVLGLNRCTKALLAIPVVAVTETPPLPQGGQLDHFSFST